MKSFDISNIAEISIRYSTKVKAANRPIIVTSKAAHMLFLASWDYTIEHVETVKLLLLNRSNRALGIAVLSKGGTAGSIVDVKLVFQYALKANASSFILCHNHPSGNIQPSESDNKLTKRIKEVGLLIDIKLIDHLIITAYDGYYSFADEDNL